MPAEQDRKEDEKKEAVKTIYNESVRLLELLNVIIPKVETYGGKVPIALLSDISELCFELGSNIIANVDDIQESEPEINEDDWSDCYPFGC